MGRLFGTDGARGVANSELTCELAMKIGRATAMVLTEDMHKQPKILIGMDTRQSGDMLESAIAAGLCSVGANVMLLGVVPTPAVAYLVSYYGYDAAIMISASHNPCEYNGIKIFQADGYKLPDEVEEEIEAVILDDARVPPVKIGGEVGSITEARHAVADYISHVRSTVRGDFKGMYIALDCANGSASATAKQLFEGLGARVEMLHCAPNGVNINDRCGSTCMETLKACVLAHGCDAGFAFDGDADRMLAVDELGEEMDGDQIIALCASHLKESGALAKDTAVVTVMSNMGFFEFCKREGIHCEITKVGDRYVLQNMRENDYVIGGEQSGHVIFLNHATTGDGQLTAVQVLGVMRDSGKKLSALAKRMEVFPQVLINVKVSAFGRTQLPLDQEIATAIRSAQRELGDCGRVLVRASGTEPLVRVMLEGKDADQIEKLGEAIAQVVRERLI